MLAERASVTLPRAWFHAQASAVTVSGSAAYALDPALVRPGRLGWHIAVGRPRLQHREEMFVRFLASVRTGEPIDTYRAARLVGGEKSGAAIRQIVEDSVALAIADEGPEGCVRWAHLRDAIGRDGTIERDAPGDEKRIAVHEAGHVCAARALDLPVEAVRVKASRGEVEYAEGVTTLDVLRRRIVASLAGIEAEALILGDQSLAGLDQSQASYMAGEIVDTGEAGWVPVNPRVWENSSNARNERYQAIKTVVADARVQARLLVERRRSDIEALADRLIASGDLSSEDLSAGDAGVARPTDEPWPYKREAARSGGIS